MWAKGRWFVMTAASERGYGEEEEDVYENCTVSEGEAVM